MTTMYALQIANGARRQEAGKAYWIRQTQRESVMSRSLHDAQTSRFSDSGNFERAAAGLEQHFILRNPLPQPDRRIRLTCRLPPKHPSPRPPRIRLRNQPRMRSTRQVAASAGLKSISATRLRIGRKCIALDAGSMSPSDSWGSSEHAMIPSKELQRCNRAH